MMMVSDMIENYENKPAFGFIEDVPCIWDQTKVITAKLGHYVSIARRDKDKWYIGSVVDENCHLLKLPLSFLSAGRKYVATIYSDSITANWENNPEAVEIGKYNVTAADTIYAAISKAGGHAVIIAPAEPHDMINHPSIREYNKLANVKMIAFEMIKTFGDLTVKHLALNKPVSLKYRYSELYPASGKNALTDGIRGTYNYSAGGWQGFEGVDMDATIDLQKEMEIQKISAGFLNSPNDWIFFPKKIEFFISSDGKDFKKIGEENCIMKKTDVAGIVEMKDFTAKISPIKARFIRVEAHSILTCPAWHPGSGKKAWLFCDEILVN
jgi:ribosomal protein L30E